MGVVAYLQEHGGVARIGAAMRATSRRQVEIALRTGEVQRLNRTVIFLPNADARMLATVAHNGSLTCVSALQHYGVTVWNPPENSLHLAVRQGWHRVYMHNVVLHAENYQIPEQIYVSPLKATVRAMRCVTDHTARIVILDSVLHKRLVAPSELEWAITSLRNPGITRAFRCADGRARSGIETIVRLELISHGFNVEAGKVIPGVGEVDFLVEGRIIVELDGFQYHSDRTAFANDRRRSREALNQGFATLRFTYHEAMTPGFIVRELRRYSDFDPLSAS